MSAPPFVSASLVIATCLFLASYPSLAQGIPPEAYKAKTIFIRNNAGGAPARKCGGVTQKSTGKGCIDAFKKQFPK